MRTTAIASLLLLAGTSAAALAQPAATSSGPAKIMTSAPAGTTVTNFYKQDVYDPSDATIGKIDDVLVDKDGQITALMIGVGGFLGMGEKDVAVAFNSVQATQKNNKWHLVLNTTKDILKSAPGFTYDSNTTRWAPAK
jgi:sporulation protein YlmC with PRC-barrel domain